MDRKRQEARKQSGRKYRGKRAICLLIGLSGLLLFGSVLAGCRAKVGPGPGAVATDVKPVRPAVVQAEPTWFACRSDNDCQVEKGLCYAPQAVNKAFIPQFKVYRDQMNQQIDCTVLAPVSAASKAQCVKRRCAIQKPTGRK